MRVISSYWCGWHRKNWTNPVLVKETLGHSNLTVTDRYLKARPNDSSALNLMLEWRKFRLLSAISMTKMLSKLGVMRFCEVVEIRVLNHLFRGA